MAETKVVPRLVHPEMALRLLDGDTNTIVWTGTLREFERDNAFDDAECAAIQTGLLRDGRYVTGGGAAQLFVLEVDGLFSLLVIGDGTHVTRRFEYLEHAALIATFLCNNAPHRFAAVITDLRTGEVVWQYAPPVFHVRPSQSAA